MKINCDELYCFGLAGIRISVLDYKRKEHFEFWCDDHIRKRRNEIKYNPESEIMSEAFIYNDF